MSVIVVYSLSSDDLKNDALLNNNVKQEDLFDFITALLKFNCFLNTIM